MIVLRKNNSTIKVTTFDGHFEPVAGEVTVWRDGRAHTHITSLNQREVKAYHHAKKHNLEEVNVDEVAPVSPPGAPPEYAAWRGRVVSLFGSSGSSVYGCA